MTNIADSTRPELDVDHVAGRLRALAHPARLAVLRTLAGQEGCLCGEIVRGMPLAQSTVSQHIKILAEAGLVRATPSGTRICYCLDKAALAALRDDVLSLFAALLPPDDGPAQPVPPGAVPGDTPFEVGTHD